MFKLIVAPIIKLQNRIFGEKGLFILFLVLFLVLGFLDTFFNRFTYNLNTPIQNWVDTAVYFNNALSPILLLATVILLYWTWKDNRKELAATKKALVEQSDTQNFSVIKDAVFEIAVGVRKSMRKNITVFDDNNEIYFINLNKFENTEIDDYFYKHSRNTTLEAFLSNYFIFMRAKPNINIERNRQHMLMIFSDETHEYNDKVKSISLFLRALKSKEYKSILEITLFSKLTIFTWLMFVEIAFHLYKTAKDEEKNTSKLVFIEIAGLTCRQMPDKTWLSALSDETRDKITAFNISM
ncbi:hypothetical protein [Pseudoalteromonas translucida]|uniref:hypothetical protein n=1 Tax=Pseudoalteromonas translucida TaxID=166935 RepID=UPI0012FEA841|nr:hypothetical protein [Pseudoalteromonas translucida]